MGDGYISVPETGCSIQGLFFVETVGHNGWLGVKDRYNKWTMTDCNTLKPVVGFKQYDSLWSFDEYGLCKVRIDQEKGYPHLDCRMKKFEDSGTVEQQ